MNVAAALLTSTSGVPQDARTSCTTRSASAVCTRSAVIVCTSALPSSRSSAATDSNVPGRPTLFGVVVGAAGDEHERIAATCERVGDAAPDASRRPGDQHDARHVQPFIAA